MLRLALELNVQLWDDPQHEKDPLVHLWLSQDVSQQLVERALKQQSQEQTLTIEEDFVVQKHPSLLPAVDRIQTACINMDFWCHLRNKHGASCLNQIGSVCVPLCDLMAQQPADKPLELDIQIPSFGDPSGQRKDDSVINYKGHLKLRLISLVLDGVPVPPASTKLLQMMGQVQRYKQTVYQHYIGSCVAMFRKFQPSWPVVKDINAVCFLFELVCCAH